MILILLPLSLIFLAQIVVEGDLFPKGSPVRSLVHNIAMLKVDTIFKRWVLMGSNCLLLSLRVLPLEGTVVIFCLCSKK